MAFLSPAPPLGGLAPPPGAFQEHAAHAREWSVALRATGSLDTCIAQVFPHSSTPLSRRTATEERRLFPVACKRWLGCGYPGGYGRDTPCLAHPRASAPAYW